MISMLDVSFPISQSQSSAEPPGGGRARGAGSGGSFCDVRLEVDLNRC